MRTRWTVGLLCLAAPLSAQQGPGAEALRQQVMQRFLQAYHTQAGLTPEQTQKFQDVFRRSLERRQQLQQHEQELWRALEAQMRPGVAANSDSVTQLLDDILAQRAAQIEQTRSEQREFATFLTPVQRAQYAIMWERLQRQIQEIVRQRMQNRVRGGDLPPDTGIP